MARKAQLPHSEHIKWRIQGSSYFVRHRNATTGQSQDHDVRSGLELLEVPSQLSSCMTAILVRLAFGKCPHIDSFVRHMVGSCKQGASRGIAVASFSRFLRGEIQMAMTTLQERGALLTGLGLGAGLMYLFDPERGRRRRALVRDRLTHSAHRSADAAGATGRDVAHRATGIVSRVRGAFDRAPVEDVVLVERVRAQLGRLVSHPHAIDVGADDGVVTLSGPILAAEVPRLLAAVERVRGVREVVNTLEEHKQAGNVPALQDGSTPPALQPEIWQREWSPTRRLLLGTAGTALAGYGASRRDVPGTLLAASGLGLLARAATNLETRRLTGIGAGRRAVDIQKTITIDAPVEEVFSFWTAYENFPRFMSRVLDVRPGTRARESHWTVAGPGGVSVEFDAEISALVPNQAFGWRTLEGATLAHGGLVRFQPTADERTRVDIRMSYNPPGGWLGHGIAAAFGVDPRSSLDADLVRLKTLLETGRAPRMPRSLVSESATSRE
jgi:uncharacterized membrane protein